MIDGSLVAPPKYLLDSTGRYTSTVNPQYVMWFENDQNIIIRINLTLSNSLIPYTVGVTSAHDLWAKLESFLRRHLNYTFMNSIPAFEQLLKVIPLRLLIFNKLRKSLMLLRLLVLRLMIRNSSILFFMDYHLI
ncbi:hypothetical protein ACFX1W_025814 [Malus domestica]